MNHDKSILGIHIDDDFLNIVHLGQTANGLQVHNWTAERLDAGIVKNGQIIDGQAVTQKIRNFVKADKLKPRKAVMSLSFSAVRLKPSEFPTQIDKQLQKQVEDQIGKYGLFGGESDLTPKNCASCNWSNSMIKLEKTGGAQCGARDLRKNRL